MGPPASATKLSRRAALSAALLQPQVKLQRAIGTACAAGSTPEPRPCTLLAAIGEAARQLGERVAAHSVQAPAIIHARLRNFQFRVGGEGKVCLALVESPGGGESHAGFRGASAGTTQERETWELLSATPEFHTGSQETDGIPGDWDRASDDMPSPSYHCSDIAT